MKQYKQFLSETSYAQNLLSGSAKDWGGAAARKLGKHIMQHGKSLGSEKGTAYTTYELDGKKFKVATDVSGNATVVHRLGEEIANSVSAGSIAGVSDNDPPVSQKKVLRRSKFAGTECFEVDPDTFHKCHLGHMKNERWSKYLKDDCEQCKAIYAYANRHPQKDIVIQREGSGEMMYLKKRGIHY